MIDGGGYNWTTTKTGKVSYPNPIGENYNLSDEGYVTDLDGFSGNGYARITLVSLD